MFIDCTTKEEDQTLKIVWILLIILIEFYRSTTLFLYSKAPKKTKINMKTEPN